MNHTNLLPLLTKYVVQKFEKNYGISVEMKAEKEASKS